MIAVDLSENGARVIALVGAREHILKSRIFGRLCTGLRHFRRVSPSRRASYIRFFERRYMKLKEVLALAKVTLSVDSAERILSFYRPAVIIVDDKLFRRLGHGTKIRESAPKPRYMDDLMAIADNLANYLRILQSKNTKKFQQVTQRITK